MTAPEQARLEDTRAAYDFHQSNLVRLRATPAPSLLVLRAIRQETATLMQLSLLLSKLEERQAPAVDPPVVSKWAGVLS